MIPYIRFQEKPLTRFSVQGKKRPAFLIFLAVEKESGPNHNEETSS